MCFTANTPFIFKQGIPMRARHCIGMISAVVLMLSFAFPLNGADFTFYVGGVDPGSIEVEDEDVSLDGSPVFGFRVGTNFVPYFGMEHTLAFSTDFLFPGNIEGPADSRGIIYNANLMFTLPVKKIEPYLTAGFGLIHQFGSSDLPVGTEPAFNYGGGFKVPRIKGPFGLRFDVRGYRAGFVTNSVNMFEMSGGIMISTGR